MGLVPVLVLGGCLCAEGSGPRAGGDAAVDAGIDAGRHEAPVGVFQSSGGGTASSAGYRMRVSFGAPQPMGTASGPSKTVTTGPGAAGR